jgi:redox-sensitive bicupin YhaK (pirin superfamily)
MMIPLQPEWVLAHIHDNMEIITIPLEGDLAHKDSMGNTGIIRNGDVQVMSAGTGVKHSEFNQTRDQRTKLLTNLG